MQLSIHDWAEITAATTCTFCLIKAPTTSNKGLFFFLWLTVAVEMSALIILQQRKEKILMYNVFTAIEYYFYSAWMLYFITDAVKRKLIAAMFIVFSVFFVVDLFFLQGIWKYNNNTMVVSCLFLVFTGLMCIHHHVQAKYKANQQASFNVWIWAIGGIMIFYAGNFFNYIFLQYFFTYDKEKMVLLYRLINHTLNVLLYGGFILSLLLEVRAKTQLRNVNQLSI